MKNYRLQYTDKRNGKTVTVCDYTDVEDAIRLKKFLENEDYLNNYRYSIKYLGK